MKTILALAFLAVVLLPAANFTSTEAPTTEAPTTEAPTTDTKQAQDQKKLEEELLEECEKREGIDTDLTDKLQGGDKDASRKVKCFLACLLEKMDILKGGALNGDVAIEKGLYTLGEEGSKAAVQKCHQVNTTDTCEIGYQTFKCYFEILKEKPKD